jgi:hypothetical protein
VRRAAVAVLALVGCMRGAGNTPKVPPADPYPGSESDDLGRLRRELEAEILDGYSRTEMIDPQTWIGMTDPGVGLVRIGVGPDDLVWTTKPEDVQPRKRWPLGDGWARTKLLQIHVTEDGSVAWAFDEVSWRLEVCGRTAVVPLRVTSFYLRDGERWVPMMEHVSYAQQVGAVLDNGLAGVALEGQIGPDAAVTGATAVRVAVEGAIGARKDADKAALFASDADALVLWPDPAHELRGSAVVTGPGLADSFDASSVTIEGYRIGLAGGGGQGASIGWWAGTLRLTARRVDEGQAESIVQVRLRATVIVERTDDLWRVVQAHVSAPISNADLASAVFGAARGADGVLRCDGAPLVPPASPPADEPPPAPAPTTAQPAEPAAKETTPPAARRAPARKGARTQASGTP